MHSPYRPVRARVAGPADIDDIVATMTTGFFQDPVWGPAFPDIRTRAEQAAELWRVFVMSALRYQWLLTTERCESAALWIPPGGSDLTPAEEAGLELHLSGIAGPRAAAGIVDVLERLDAVRPAESHYYLSLLATHSDHRGQGIGSGLLTENLARVDAEHMPAYLESTNPANDRRYARVGFEVIDRPTLAGGHVVSTMWRTAR